MTFSLTESVHLCFAAHPGLPHAVFVCDTNGMVIRSDGFINTQAACADTIGSEHMLWDTSDFLRFDPQTLALRHFSIAPCDPNGSGHIAHLDTSGPLYQTHLTAPCPPFALSGAHRTLWVEGTTLYSVYNRHAEAQTLRRISPNLGMMFDADGRICGWRMTQYLDVFCTEGQGVERPAEGATYAVFAAYFTTFTVAAFEAEEDEVVGLCERFLATHAAQALDPRCAALMRWVGDIAERYQD